MKTFKLVVNCGRAGKKGRDWMIVTHIDGMSYFNGFGFKKHATRFVSVEQAKGAIKMHCIQQRIKDRDSKHKIFRIEVDT